MSDCPVPPPPLRLCNQAGLWFELLSHGGVRRAGLGEDILGLFVGLEAEAPFANLWLRCPSASGVTLQPLLGPSAAGRWTIEDDGLGACFEAACDAAGAAWRWRVHLRLASAAAAWFWHVELFNAADAAQVVEPVWLQDIALSAYGALRLNEHYVSQYVDLQPIDHAGIGTVIAARQNQPVGGRHPWAVLGGLQPVRAWATDALQVQGLAPRLGGSPEGLVKGLPGRRVQHEHACAALQGSALAVAPGECVTFGWFGRMEPDHPGASGTADLALVEATLALPEARRCALPWPERGNVPAIAVASPSLFVASPWLPAEDPDESWLEALFGGDLLHEERDAEGRLLSAFLADGRHLVTRAKEARVLRPHGHLLRGGRALVPDEGAMTSTVWMGGVFHSMLTQGHVSINRLLSTVHGYLGMDRSHGLRLFADAGAGWCQLGTPSVFEMAADHARWIYRHPGGVLEVTSAAHDETMSLHVRVLEGGPMHLRCTLHVALAGDDGAASSPPRIELLPAEGEASGRTGGGLRRIRLSPPAGSELARRFPGGAFLVEAVGAAGFEAVAGDDACYADGRPRGEPFVCLDFRVDACSASVSPSLAGLRIAGALVPGARPAADEPLPALSWEPPKASSLRDVTERLSAIVPWFCHDALIHYLAPRGLEQYSGGGWGTRDVCQGPLEALLALGRMGPVRDLLCRTFAAQNVDGDWPQWFMFFEREREIRAGDSHGDIVFWPLVGLARYLLASGDASLLDQPVAFFGQAQALPVWAHVSRALELIEARRIPGTALAAYGHGDWNDSLQPADPALRERLCSAWTVTLHHQMLTVLARALDHVGRPGPAETLRDRARRVRADFRRLLLRDGVVAGYALFEGGPEAPELLLHPRDARTGLHYSLLPMMHAVLEDMLAPDEAAAQMRCIRERLLAPDGARLFDAPLPYRGGLQRLFQRAESSSFFGREIGVMYVHAHLRYAQALAHMGDGDGFIDALARINPIGLQAVVPNAAPRQANAYFSSSDAAFADRVEASARYGEVLRGDVPVEAGWRVYSSGPGIFLHLVARHIAGVVEEAGALVFDPVLPLALDGLEVRGSVWGRLVRIVHHVQAAGCGPVSVRLAGQVLPFVREPHPYRPGAARVSGADWLARLPAEGVVTLEVTTGAPTIAG